MKRIIFVLCFGGIGGHRSFPASLRSLVVASIASESASSYGGLPW
ncbi:MAG: hypothetical protein RSA56_06135 [Raoultibacter sp.]